MARKSSKKSGKRLRKLAGRKLAELRVRTVMPQLLLAAMPFKLGTKQHRALLTAVSVLNMGDFDMARKSKGKIHKVMGEFKRKKLHSGSKHGPKVKSRKQAIAIAMSEARRGKK